MQHRVKSLRTGLLDSKWSWFVNPGVEPPAGAELIGVDSIHWPDHDSFAGLGECILVALEGDIDIRAGASVDVAEGALESPQRPRGKLST